MPKIDSRPSLVVTDGTTFDDAKTFLAKAEKEGQKVYGKVDKKTGQTTIYAKSRSSRWDVLTKKHLVKQSTGREGLQKVFQRLTPERAPELSKNGREAYNTLFDSIRTGLDGQGALVARDASTRLTGFEVLVGHLPKRTASPSSPAGPGRGVADSPFDRAIGRTLTHFRRGHPLSAAALGTRLAEDLRQTHPGRPAQYALALSDPAAMEQHLVAALEAHLPSASPQSGLTRDDIARLARSALASAFQDLAQAKFVATPHDKTFNVTARDKGRTVQTVELSSIWSENKLYKPIGLVAIGNSGAVFRFRADDGTEKALKLGLFKSANGDVAGQVSNLAEAAKREIQAHLTVEGGGDPHILHLQGAVTMPDGRIGMLMDFAEFGTGDDLRLALHDDRIKAPPDAPWRSGQLGMAEIETISLTLAGDMLMGTERMSSQNLISFDQKLENTLIMGGGRLVHADFGSAVNADKVKFSDFGAMTAPFKSPESETVTSAYLDAKRPIKNALKDELGTALGRGGTDGSMEKIVEQIAAAKAEIAAGEVGHGADVWSLGATFVHLMSDQTISSHYDLPAFAAGNGKAVQPRDDREHLAAGALFGSLGGSTAADAFANSILVGRSSERPTARALRADAALRAPGVGSQEARDVAIAAIRLRRVLDKPGTEQDIADARLALDASVQALNQRKADDQDVQSPRQLLEVFNI